MEINNTTAINNINSVNPLIPAERTRILFNEPPVSFPQSFTGDRVLDNNRRNIFASDQLMSNTQTFVSLLQTADIGLREIETLLTRMREMSFLSTTNALEEGALQAEADRYLDRIDTITAETYFNGRPVFNGELYREINNNNLGTRNLQITEPESREQIDEALVAVNSERQYISATVNMLQNGNGNVTALYPNGNGNGNGNGFDGEINGSFQSYM